MTSSTTTHRHFLLAALLLASASTACDSKPDSAPVEDEEEQRPSGIALPLIEGRNVEIDAWINQGGALTRTTVRGGFYSQPLGVFTHFLRTACNLSEVTVNGYNLEDLPPETSQACLDDALPGEVGIPNVGTVANSGLMPVVTNCVAQWALHIAEANEPLYLAGSSFQMILPHGKEVPEPFKTLLAVAAQPNGEAGFPEFIVNEVLPTLRAWSPETVELLFTVRPPSASDRASWALIAAELFRAAALTAGTMLTDPVCMVGGDTSFISLAGERATRRELLVGNFADALKSSIEAAEKAQRFIAAAATEGRAGAVDQVQAVVNGWRARHDSRLESISAFVPVHESLYQSVQSTPLFATGPTVNGMRLPTAHLTTRAADVLAPWYVTGWILPPETPNQQGLLELRSWKHDGTNQLFATTATNVAGASLWRREGYVHAGTGAGLKELTIPLPDGVSASDHVPVFIHDDSDSFDRNPVKYRFPVVTALSKTPGDLLAEELIRQVGVNPCLPEQDSAWCRKPVRVEGRTVDDIADELLEELKLHNPGAYGQFEDADEFLASQFIRKDDLVRAATRIVQSSHALGHWIEKAGESELVYGTRGATQSAHPAYLYAQTAGRPQYAEGDWQELQDVEFSRKSIAYLMTWADGIAKSLIHDYEDGEAPIAWNENLKQLRGTLRQYTEHADLTVRTTVEDSRITKLEVTRGGLDVSAWGAPAEEQAQLAKRCDVWLNEGGLRCALAPSGRWNCRRYLFGKPTWTEPVETEPGYSSATATILAGDAPQRYDGVTPERRLDQGDRLYVVCDLGSGPEPIAALTVNAPTRAGAYTWKHPPFSRAVLDALAQGLGPDPEHPEQTAFSCAGVPYDVKIPLENELSEAVEGSDDIESSFVHYMRLARQAADRADELGNELVMRGIAMDERAEGAREELEDLCGGVVNVPSFAQAACRDSSSCDVAEVLTSMTPVTGDLSKDTDLSGAAQCLGVGTAGKPTWAALGNRELCIWQYYDNNGAPFVPMVCPGEHASCGKYDQKVQLAPGGEGTCADVFGHGIENLDEVTDTQPGVTYALRVSELLNMTVTSTGPQPETKADKTEFLCRSALARRAPNLIKYERADWMTQSKLASVAESIGYEEDAFGLPTLTLSGRSWISFGNADQGPKATAELHSWPYEAHPMLEDDPAIPSPQNPDGPEDEYDAEAVKTCNDGLVTGDVSLLCGGLTRSDLSSIRNRLRGAVVALKGLTGASFDNVIIREQRKYAKALIPIQDDMDEAGPAPGWFTGAVPGSMYYRTFDRSGIAFEGQTASWWSRRKAYRPYMVDDKVATRASQHAKRVEDAEMQAISSYLPDATGIHDRGWAPAHILWSRRPPKEKNEGTYLGIGHFLDFLDHKRDFISSQVSLPDFCPNIPNSLEICDYGASYGFAPGRCKSMATSHFGNNIRRFVAPRPFTEAEIISTFGQGDPEHATVQLLLDYACEKEPVHGARVDSSALYDALDLACVAMDTGAASCATLLSDPPAVNGIEDFPALSQRMNCAAETVQQTLDRFYVAEMPLNVIRDLAQGGAVQTFPEHRGMYGQTVAELAAELIAVRAQGDMVVQAMRDVGTILNKAMVAAEALELNIKIGDIDEYIEGRELDLATNALLEKNIRTRQAISHAATECVTAMLEATGDWAKLVTFRSFGDVTAAAFTCANTGLKIATENQLKALNESDYDIEVEKSQATIKMIELGEEVTKQQLSGLMYQTALDVSAQFDKVHEAMLGLQKAQAGVQGLLAKLAMQRNQARRAAAKALLLGSDETGRVYNVNLGMRARMNTLRIRYERARENAVRMAYMARRAVEQKLGVDLSFMMSDMTLVEAPNKWVDKLCSASGINYERIRNGGQAPGSETGAGEGSAPEDYDYADGYVGDWVTRLENFVESYSVDMPFQAGTDVAVVSLRDEIMNVREPGKEIASWNLLYHSDGKSFCSLKDSAHNCVRGWQMTCNGGQAVLADVSLSSPFYCESGAVGCRPLGMGQAMMIGANPQSCVAPEPPPPGSLPGTSEPPQDQLEYWFRADQCTAVGGEPELVSDCTNLGENPGPDRTLRSVPAGTNFRRIAAGIGGRETLELGAPGPNLGVPSAPDLVNEYTVVAVVRPLNSGQAILYGSSHSTGAGGSSDLQFDNNVARFAWSSVSPSSSSTLSARIPAPASPTSKTQPTVLVGVADTSGSRFYVNGELRAWSPVPTLPQTQTGWAFVSNDGGAVQLAEHLRYSRALSNQELASLDSYLIHRYGLHRLVPARWIEADDIANARSNDGISTSSGYPGSTTAIYDRALGSIYSTAGFPLVTFSLGHSGIPFNNQSLLVDEGSGYSCNKEVGAQTCAPRETDFEGFDSTLVARVAAIGASNQEIYQESLKDSMVVRLQLDAASRRLMLRWENLQSGQVATYTSSEAGTIVEDVPFVVTMHGSAVSDYLRIYLNGVKIFDVSEKAIPQGRRTLGGVNNLWLNGAIAEWRHYVTPRSEADVLALQQELGTKYNIQVTPDSPIAGINGAPRMRQVVQVEPGSHWLSWMQRAEDAPLEVLIEYPDGSQERFNDGQAGSEANVIYPLGGAASSPTDPWLDEEWLRYYVPVEVSSSGALAVGFIPEPLPSGGTYAPVAIAGMQLERMASDQSELPRAFFATADVLSAKLGDQEDRDGSTFRTRWHEDCEYYCPPGTGKDCAAGGDTTGLPKRCFLESDFAISLEEVEKGNLIQQAGFAKGNFNYRFDDIGVNVVGTGIKNCEDSELPSACYAGSFLQYSLVQNAPFRTRNYDGNSVRASLHTGKIQQAKALLAERYLTNPMSSADRNMMADYWRSEFRGRPLDGAFKLRIYKSPDLQWANVEDVQLVLRYRYWTRLD